MAAAAAAKWPNPSSFRPGYEPRLWGWKGILGVKGSFLGNDAALSVEGMAVEGAPLGKPLEVRGTSRIPAWGDAVISVASRAPALSKLGGSEG